MVEDLGRVPSDSGVSKARNDVAVANEVKIDEGHLATRGSSPPAGPNISLLPWLHSLRMWFTSTPPRIPKAFATAEATSRISGSNFPQRIPHSRSI